MIAEEMRCKECGGKVMWIRLKGRNILTSWPGQPEPPPRPETKEPEQTVTIPLDEYVWLKICEDRLFMQDEHNEDESPEISKMDGYVGTF